MHGEDISCEIWKVVFEMPHKLTYPYADRCAFDIDVKFEDLLGLRARKRFWNGPH